jgi:hypothetical protein
MALLNKRGDINIIVFAILVLLAGGILLAIFPALFNDVAHTMDRTKCETQVNLHSVEIFEGKLPGELDQCETNSFEVNEDDEEEIKKILADEMYYCWDQFGEGRKDFISEWRTTGRWCFICSRIDYDSRVQSDFPTIDNFDLYLRDNEFPYFTQNKSVSFYNYFYEDGNMPDLDKEFKIDTGKSSYVVFFADKEKNWNDMGKGLGAGVGGGVVLCGVGILVSPISGGATLLLCAAAGGAIASGVGYATNHHPDFSAGLYIGDAAGAAGACSGS